jgi:lipid-binding SYLF domain-containing protein
LQVGTELSDVILLLNSQEAVEAFSADTQVSLGTELGVSVGPLGRVAGTDLLMNDEGKANPIYSYAHSKGLFAGISLEAAAIFCRESVNRAFYGEVRIQKYLLSIFSSIMSFSGCKTISFTLRAVL